MRNIHRQPEYPRIPDISIRPMEKKLVINAVILFVQKNRASRNDSSFRVYQYER